MSITETPTEAPRPKRKYTRRKRKPMKEAQVSEYAGLSITDCPTACNAERCVISGVGICAHPRKGGLQGRCINDESMARLDKAIKIIGKRKTKIGTD